ncbi:MAG: hypothetical protein AABY09_02980 [Nanoarchaeota archaeon]
MVTHSIIRAAEVLGVNAKMRKNPRLFGQEEFMYLHQVYLKTDDGTQIYKKIKAKKGVGLDMLEIKHVKKKFSKWMSDQDNTVFLPSGDREDRGF